MSTPQLPIYVAGQPVTTGDWLDVTDKYSGKVAAQVAHAGPAQVEQAISAAHEARAEMAAFPPDARRDVLEHCVRRFGERRDELAELLCTEAGKPIRDSRGEVDRLIDTFGIAAGEATRINGEVFEMQVSPRAHGFRGMTRRVPIGACSFITPFNFPLNLVAHKVAPAIAAGCPFVLKPSERTPLGAQVIGQVLAETDLPRKAWSVIVCDTKASAPMVEDPRIALLSFTGGPIGWDLRARAGRKKVALELGGNAACIVDEDPGVPLDHLVKRLVFGAYYQSGQSCISVQRVIVHRAMAERVSHAMAEAVRALKCGNPHDEATDIGPVIDAASADRLEEWIRAARDAGGRVLVEGRRDGTMIAPWLLADVAHDAKLYREEAFGPVALIETVDSFDAALDRANDSHFGLQCGVFTARLDHAMRAWDRLEVGGVVISDVPSVRVDNMPYGGVKDSGVGREGVRSAIEEMTEVRLLVIKDPPAE
ncbi:aldehyde dehydrogenase family protein [Lysobacter sp. TY2-98]|uniref:aldehyde dehydrogenase family protein n=1 Tax=Lysobacter sp. TY2-98 TaxID=2290922 RepID=UPI000E207396|nr:aldehyde dehydrogenase family protein [Lysobacter sp. TY2-98]AXK72284.1 aldehyde dehydrogenase family protein [Lysobacter sp. TY2-98]